MRRFVFVIAIVALAAAACGGGSADEPGVVVKISTPAAGGSPTEAAAGPSAQIAPPELVFSTTEIFQGGATLVSVVGELSGGRIELFGQEHTLIQGARSMFSFVGVPVDQAPGPYTMTVAFTLANGTKGTMPADITVLATDWTVDSLTFTDGQTQSFLDAQVISDEESLLRDVYAIDSGTKLWEGPWQIPVDGPVTARFGEQRSINGGEPEGHHGGTDLGVPEGTPVHATSHGVVVMARQMALRGNFIVIDHGGGLLSGYGHLSQFSVAEGQTVEPGQVIGLVGNTGLSTGAHLHWEMAVDGVLVDAWRFVDGTNGL